MAKKVAALLVAILISKSSGATDSDTQKVAAIQKRRYFSGVFNNPGYGGKFCISLKICQFTSGISDHTSKADRQLKFCWKWAYCKKYR